MQLRILGPVEVCRADGSPAPVAGARVRSLLARLALQPGRAVSSAALVDAVWGPEPPAEEVNALQSLVSRLRRGLGDPSTVVSSAAGYGLAGVTVDADEFSAAAAAGAQALHRGDLGPAIAALEQGLALWRGPALADAGDDPTLRAHAARLDEARRIAQTDRIDALLQSASTQVNGVSLVAELEALSEARPHDERVAGLLLRALAADGRPAQALRHYEAFRSRLSEQLGTDPAAELQDLHLQLLRGQLGSRQPAPRQRGNVKAQLTSFVGREQDIARVVDTMQAHRLVTLIGPGGAGKTRLASEAVATIPATACDVVWFVELAPLTSGADIGPTVLNALGAAETSLLERRVPATRRDLLTRLTDALADKRVVLVFDNCEHLVQDSAQLADELLARCPQLRILATSREPLAITGEVLLAVPPLGLPGTEVAVEQAAEFAAVRLFADRGAAVRSDFVIDDRTVGPVVEIVNRLDGLPLAIELAAARLRTMGVADIAARLDDRFRLLTGGSRTALPRHRTLRAVVDWSWELLEEDERELAERLAVFPGGITESSAAAVCAMSEGAASDLLGALIDKSLLQPLDSERRLRMLETIREYGIQRLADRGELDTARRLHARYFTRLVMRAEPHLTTADQLPWFDLMHDERDNIVAALHRHCAVGDAEAALRLAVCLAGYTMMIGDHVQLSGYLSDALAVPGGTDSATRLVAQAVYALNAGAATSPAPTATTAEQTYLSLVRQLDSVRLPSSPLLAMLQPALAFFGGDEALAQRYIDKTLAEGSAWSSAAMQMFLANIAENAGDIETMRQHLRIAISGFRELGERWGLSNTLRMDASLRVLDGDLAGAVSAFEEALRLTGELRSDDDVGFVLGRLAEIALRTGDLDAAREYANRAREFAQRPGAGIEAVFVTAILSTVELEAGDLVRARSLLQDADRRLNALPADHPMQSHVRAFVGASAVRLALSDGDTETAGAAAQEAYEAACSTRDLPVVALVGMAVADLHAHCGQAQVAAVMLGAAARLRGAEDPTSPWLSALQARLREQLGDAEFERAYTEGNGLDRDGALERLRPSGVTARA